MITEASKVFLPVSGVALALLVLYGMFTGDHGGTIALLLLSMVAAFCGVVVAAVRDRPVAAADADAPEPVVAGGPLPRPVAGGESWPVAAAVAAALLAVAMVGGPVFAVAGAAVLAVTVIGWLAAASADRTGRVAFLLPIGLPVLGLTAIASLMFFMSRILLAVSEQASTFIALAVAVLILAGASVVALRPGISRRALAGALALGTVTMAGGGIVAAAMGEREIGHADHETHGAVAIVDVVARNTAFDVKKMTFKADSEVLISFTNRDPAPHNVAIYRDAQATERVFVGDLIAGPAQTQYRFRTPHHGTYHFRCDVHPNMAGRVEIL